MRVIAGDVGGTKTLLRLIEVAGDRRHVIREKRFLSADYASFNALLGEFRSIDGADIDAACFAVAGPVVDGRASITNLTWNIDPEEIADICSIGAVRLVNDFYGVARGIPLLTPGDVLTINAGQADRTAPIGIVGAGTGLGEAILVPVGEDWIVIPSEGGHCDFAPHNEEQDELRKFLAKKFGHVSYERIASGQGISNVYQFLAARAGIEVEVTEDLPMRVAHMADAFDRIAIKTLDLFLDVYGAEAGNMALKVLARGGIYLAGGVSAKHAKRFSHGIFFEAFCRKGRFSSLMHTIPVHVVLNEQVGLMGATAIAMKMSASR